ncbi:MAG: hypothetical protein H7070_15080 [Saprospiraceae bacterium]|nr:hypothetical protein [Pyrinomonadaceae bacterium]
MMRQILSPKVFSLIAAALFAPLFVQGQDAPPEEAVKPLVERPAQQRPNLLRELGLLPEQIRQIRRINMERKPLMEAAQIRLRQANRDLDLAIYADDVRDEDVRLRLNDFQAAQAEVAKIRFASELAIRKLLAPEQLVKFRELRQGFADIRKNIEERRRNQKDMPKLRRMNRPVRPVVNE